MVKLWILTVLAVVACAQIANARDVAEALNVNIREQLSLYAKFQKEADSAKYTDELKKLVTLTEEALKIESADEKNKIITTAPSHFSAEFNTWIGAKLEEAQVHDDIHDAIEFYNSLLTTHAEHEAEIKKTISTLENLLKESDLKQKEEKFLDLEKSFSPEFQKFLKENALPTVNRQLQKTAEFFENLLHDKDIKFAKEIEALKLKTEAALESNVSIDDKNKVLQEVTYSSNEDLNEFLQKKNIEYS
ncbi:uncharacterized protein LOC135951705 [Calliphora vicina]|uniref:uncharacterized protein LOC135951705 n=1 Tax=Calliphora vicina TaxID=7373 RepID=UPI00325ABCF6